MDEKVSRLISGLKSTDADTRNACAYALSIFGWHAAPAIPALIQGMKDPDEGVSWNCSETLIKVIGCFHDKPESRALLATLIPTLIETLKDPNQYIRHACIHVLREAGSAAAPAVPALVEALDHSSSSIRASSAVALGSIGKDAFQAIPALEARKTKEHDTFVRARIVRALQLIREES